MPVGIAHSGGREWRRLRLRDVAQAWAPWAWVGSASVSITLHSGDGFGPIMEEAVRTGFGAASDVLLPALVTGTVGDAIARRAA
ncbi:hypothetical protein [Alsobacter sp. R-9]